MQFLGKQMTFLELAKKILEEEGRPLSAQEISKLALSKGYYKVRIKDKAPPATRLLESVSLALEGGEVIISEGDKPVARLVPFAETEERRRVADLNEGEIWASDNFDEPLISTTSPGQKRVAGLHRGAAWVSEDFDEPLPDGFWLGSDE
jgi:antitoxin (DNA-binding transcriptional repressor) of toxin-antitoxin stability system